MKLAARGAAAQRVGQQDDITVLTLAYAPAEVRHAYPRRSICILAEEHIAYTEAIARVAGGEYEIVARRYVKSTLHPPRDV